MHNFQTDSWCNSFREYARKTGKTGNRSVNNESSTNTFVGEELNSTVPSISIEQNVSDVVAAVSD